MEMFIGLLIGAMVGSAAASLMRVRHVQGVYLNVALGVAGAIVGGVGLCLLFPAPLPEFGDELATWCVAGAAGALALVTLGNVLELCFDLEAG